MDTQWAGKNVAFIGDSITDPDCFPETRKYWDFLRERLQITPWVYAVSGWQWNMVREQAEKMYREHGDAVDAVLIFMGTNDFNGNVPIGNYWKYAPETVNQHGKTVSLPRRFADRDPDTLCGRIHLGLGRLKELYPRQQIVILTPIHRGFAQFGGDNVQPEESFPNELGRYVEEYIQVIREAGSVYAVPVIDLFSVSGLLPVMDAYTAFFQSAENDRLHPNTAGHERIARTIMYQLSAMPANFK